MKILLAYICMTLALASTTLANTITPNLPDGYAQFPWGTELNTVLKALPKAREVHDGELQRLEKKALKSTKRKKMSGFKKSRLRNFRFWKQIAGLPARVELSFFDDVLYAARVHLLYRRKDQRKLKVLYQALQSKYGPPMRQPGATDPIEERDAFRFALADGSLQVDKLTPSKGRRGLFRFVYRSESIGTQVEEYQRSLEAEMLAMKAAKARKKTERKRQRSEDAINRMKDQL